VNSLYLLQQIMFYNAGLCCYMAIDLFNYWVKTPPSLLHHVKSLSCGYLRKCWFSSSVTTSSLFCCSKFNVWSRFFFFDNITSSHLRIFSSELYCEWRTKFPANTMMTGLKYKHLGFNKGNQNSALYKLIIVSNKKRYFHCKLQNPAPTYSVHTEARKSKFSI